MRLGSYPCKVTPGTILEKAYKTMNQVQGDVINERHRHRYEFNNDYRTKMQEAGLTISGTSPDETLVEAVEVEGQFHVGVQFHPEFKSRPNRPHPLFTGFVGAALDIADGPRRL